MDDVGELGFKVVAGENVKSLGLVFVDKPPGSVKVKKVSEGTWAEQVGIKPGYTIVGLNGEDLEYMPTEQFAVLLKSRPLSLFVEMPPPNRRQSLAGIPRNSVLARAAARRSGSFTGGSLRRGSETQLRRNSSIQAADDVAQRTVLEETDIQQSQLPDHPMKKSQSRRSTKRVRASQITESTPSSPTSTEQVRQRKSRKSTMLVDAATLERKKEEYIVLQRTLRQVEDEMKNERDHVGRVQKELKAEQAACQKYGYHDGQFIPADKRGELVKVLKEVYEWSSKFTSTERKESEEVFALREEYNVSKESIRKRSFVARQEAQAMQTQVGELRNITRRENAVASAEQAKIRKLIDDAPPIVQEVEEEEESRLQQLQALGRAEEVAARGAHRRQQNASKRTHDEVTSEFADEISTLRRCLKGEEAAVRGMKRNANDRLAEATIQLSRKDGGILRAEEAALRGLQRTEDQVRLASYDLADALDNEMEAMEKDRALTLRSEGNLQTELVSLETHASSMLGDPKVLKYATTKNELRAASETELALRSRYSAMEKEETKARGLLSDLEADVDASKIGGVRRNLQYANEELEEMRKKCAVAEEISKACLTQCTQATYEIRELRAALTNESEAAGKSKQDLLSGQQDAAKLNNDLYSLEQKVLDEENRYDETRRRLCGEVERTRKLQAESVVGGAGQAEIAAYEASYGLQKSSLEKTTLAKEAGRIADRAEMAALRSGIMHEEAELSQYSKVPPNQHQIAYDRSKSEVEIAALKSALSRERVGLADFSASNIAYVELESKAAAEQSEAAEVNKLHLALREQESEILKLQFLASESQSEGVQLQPLPSPVVLSASDTRNAAGQKLQLTLLESDLAKQRSLVANLSREYTEEESEARMASHFVGELRTLRNALEEQQKQHTALERALQQGAVSTPGGGRDTAEVIALKSSISAEQAEAQALRAQQLGTPRSSDGNSREVVALRNAIANEELQCRLLREMAPPNPPAIQSRYDVFDHDELLSLKAALAQEKVLINDLSQQLKHARQASSDANEILKLKMELADAKAVQSTQATSCLPAHPQPKRIVPGTQARPGVPARNVGQLGKFPVQSQPFGATFSGGEIAEISRQVEAAQLKELRDKANEAEQIAGESMANYMLETSVYNKLKMTYGVQEAEVHELMRYPTGKNPMIAGTDASNAAELASARVVLAREASTAQSLEADLAKIETEAVVDVDAFKKASQEAAAQHLALRNEIRTVQQAVVQQEAENTGLYASFGEEEAGMAEKSRAMKASYNQELRHLRNRITAEEEELLDGFKRRRTEAVASAIRATMAEEERTMRMLMRDNADKVEVNLGELQELGQLNAKRFQEQVAYEKVEQDLAKAEKAREVADKSAALAAETRKEKMQNMKQASVKVHKTNRELEMMAVDRSGSAMAEAQQLDRMRAAHLQEKAVVFNLRDKVKDTEMQSDAAHAAGGVQLLEIESMKAKLKHEMKDASFGKREMIEINHLRDMLSTERSAASVLRLDKTDLEARIAGLEITFESEEMSLQAALRRANDNSGKRIQDEANKFEEMDVLQSAVHSEEDLLRKIAQETDKADARCWACESSIRDLELREDAAVQAEMHRGATFAQMQAIEVEAGARVIEEQAAKWCEEAGHRSVYVTEAQLQNSLDTAEDKTRQLRQLYNAADEYASETADLRRHMANETAAAQNAFAHLHRIRAAEGRMLQDAMAEVWEATSKNAGAIKHRDAMKMELDMRRQELEQCLVEIDGVRGMLTAQAPHAPQTSQQNRDPVPLHAALQDARGVFSDHKERKLQHALSSLSQGPVSPRSPTPLGIPMLPIPSPGAVTSGPMLAPLGSHASSLRMQAEGLRGEMKRFQARRAQQDYK